MPTCEQSDAATRVLNRIATVCAAALDPQLSREQVIVRLKEIYAQAVSLADDEDDDGE
jgi:hypothetical protein